MLTARTFRYWRRNLDVFLAARMASLEDVTLRLTRHDPRNE